MQQLKSYLLHNKIWTLVGIYAVVGTVLNIFFSINILPPCIIKTFTGVSCPGCGLTHAVLSLVQLDFAGAWQANPLVFVVVPALAFFVWKDWTEFKKRKKPA